mmetsp:Transcript_90484/g.230127  ORF Transcript_90484/g.230127 Transcript_90484/m.230127 type:complete len:512 (+) Transcript_90484:50-1585(+)
MSPWAWVATVVVLAACAPTTGEDASVARYVLCQDAPSPPAARLPGGRLSVFAASIARRWNVGVVLRAALMWESDAQGWMPHFSRIGADTPDSPFTSNVEAMSYEDAAHRTGISPDAFASPAQRRQVLGRYAKCFGASLPESARLRVRLGLHAGAEAIPANASYSTDACGIMRFRNGELEHEVAHCSMPPGTARSWRVAHGGAPARLNLDLGAALDPGKELWPLSLQLCRVDKPLMGMSFCSMPLYGMRELKHELPMALEDWLAYHLNVAGLEHAEIYDVDGSFEEALRPELREWLVASGKLTYHKRWPETLSAGMAKLSAAHPSCSETWAYLHCLTTHRALSRWVVILHSPDEYLAAPTAARPRGVVEAFEHAMASSPQDSWVPCVSIQAANRASSGMSVDALHQRGAVLAASGFRGPNYYPHTPILDPAACACAGPHACYKSVSAFTYGGPMLTIDASFMVVHHFVEMLSRDWGRCSRLPASGGVCSVEDDSMAWVLPLLRAGVPWSFPA